VCALLLVVSMYFYFNVVHSNVPGRLILFHLQASRLIIITCIHSKLQPITQGQYLGSYGGPPPPRVASTTTEPASIDEAALVEEIVEELVDRRGLGVSGVMQAVRRTRARDLHARWPAWRRNCDCLLALGFSPHNVTTILVGASGFLHELDAERDIRRVCFYLWEDLGFEGWGKIGLGLKSWQRHKYKVVTQNPSVLRRGAEVGGWVMWGGNCVVWLGVDRSCARWYKGEREGYV
jgi:hypothetical protein